MRWRFALVLTTGLVAAPASYAQLPGFSPFGSYPGQFNQTPAARQGGSPLSPYLNLANNGNNNLNNAAINYYNFTRPYTNAYSPSLLNSVPQNGPRQSFFPTATSLSNAFASGDAADAADRPIGKPGALPPAGRGAWFNNTSGYFGGPGGGGSGGRQQQSQRPATGRRN